MILSYVKQNFVDGMVLTAAHLNTIEDQLVLDSDHTHDSIYEIKGAAMTAETNAKSYADNLVSEALKTSASQSWVTEQMQLAIDATWEAMY